MLGMGCVSSAAVAISEVVCEGGEGVREETGGEMVINLVTSRSAQAADCRLPGGRISGELTTLYNFFYSWSGK